MHDTKLARLRKLLILCLFDLISIFVAAVIGVALGTPGDLHFDFDFLHFCLANILATGLFFTICSLYSLSLRGASFVDGIRICLACILIGIVNAVFVALTDSVSYQQALVFVIIYSLFTAISRFSYRILQLYMFINNRRTNSNLKRIVIVGAGQAGIALVKELVISKNLKYLPVAFVDDDLAKVGQVLQGIKIAGTTKEVSRVVRDFEAQEIIIAISSISKQRKKQIVDECSHCGVPVSIVPGIIELVSGEVKIQQIRPVNIVDLLGRDEVKVNIDNIIKYIKGKVVLVTGGGGSIGSELCRQIASHSPKQLIIFDIYENNAYEIEQELKRHHPELNLLTLIGSIRDSSKLKSMFEKYNIDIVFNAAAHKHVPLMETSPNEAIKNNAIGTLKLARLADQFKVKTFVQISTDKAVNPTNIMGASKRICEMIIQTIGKHSKSTNFVAVRFGNVLGSNGSVIPLFKKQIEEGGPVTLTHRDIIRYFMTIPEAVSLVLEAGAYAKKGQIFVLDMGEPVRIYDLAVNLIKLSGLTPGVDIEIKETGLRPGEKLYEERLMEEEGLEKTENGLISIAQPIEIKDEKKFFDDLDKLYDLAYKETDKMKEVVAKLVPTYKITPNKIVKKK